MFQTHIKIWSTLLAYGLSLALLANSAWASEREERLRDLEALKQEIAQISQKISQQQKQRSKQSRSLQALEQTLAETAAENFALKTRQQLIEAEILELTREKKDTGLAIVDKSEKLAGRLQLLYQMKDRSQLSLWLSSRNPVEKQRTAIALRTINEQTAEQIADLQNLQTRQTTLETQLLARQEQSAAQLIELERTHTELQEQRVRHKQLLSKLDSELADAAEARSAREQDQLALESLIKKLNERVSKRFEAARRAADAYPFGKTKGKLQWPATGDQVVKFGQRKPDSSRRWQGITIAADAGTTVHSIYSGTVIFADYLPAQGMLIIVDHGEGYWSLYGRNETLVRQVGDFVTTGETIATVGSSGGHKSAELYLEVRKDGKPQNPVGWFSKRA